MSLKFVLDVMGEFGRNYYGQRCAHRPGEASSNHPPVLSDINGRLGSNRLEFLEFKRLLKIFLKQFHRFGNW